MKDKISVIILNYNTPEATKKAITTFAEAERNLEVEYILIDNNSSKKVDEDFIQNNNIIFIQNNDNLGFARGVNQGITQASHDNILLLNSDVFIKEKSISKMIEYYKNNPDIGVIGAKLIYPTGKTQPSSGKFPNLIREFLRFSMISKFFIGGTIVYKNKFSQKYYSEAQEVDWVSGGCMLIKKEVINKIGNLDGDFFFGIEDFDFCYRAKKAGFKIYYYPLSEVVHYHGYSSGGRRSTWSLAQEEKGMNLFLKKHFSHKVISRVGIDLMYKIKIIILNFIFKIK